MQGSCSCSGWLRAWEKPESALVLISEEAIQGGIIAQGLAAVGEGFYPTDFDFEPVVSAEKTRDQQ